MLRASAAARSPCLARRHPLSEMRPHRLARGRGALPVRGKVFAWRMWWWSARNGATRARARSSIGCPSRPTSSFAFRADTTPATRSSSTASPTSSRCCPPASCASKLSVIGNGVVVDPQALIDEIGRLKEQGVTVTPETLRIAENATLILPLHQELDVAREKASGNGSDRHHRPRHRPGLRGQGRPPRDPPDGPRRSA